MSQFGRFRCQNEAANGERCGTTFSIDHFTAAEQDYYCYHHREQAGEVEQ